MKRFYFFYLFFMGCYFSTSMCSVERAFLSLEREKSAHEYALAQESVYFSISIGLKNLKDLKNEKERLKAVIKNAQKEARALERRLMFKHSNNEQIEYCMYLRMGELNRKLQYYCRNLEIVRMYIEERRSECNSIVSEVSTQAHVVSALPSINSHRRGL